MAKNRNQCDIHHVYPSSRGGTNNPENKAWVNAREHAKFHEFFENRTPHDQIFKLLRWDSQVIIEPTFEEIVEVVKQKVKDKIFYKKGIAKGL